MHQFCNGLGLHSLHDAGAVKLDGLFDDAEVAGNLLVEPAGRNRRLHLALARRQRFEAVVKLGGY